jgi:hypothetical protein
LYWDNGIVVVALGCGVLDIQGIAARSRIEFPGLSCLDHQEPKDERGIS